MSDRKSRGAMPPDIQSRWNEAQAGLDRKEIEATLAKAEAAAAEDSFSGFVRRCVRSAGQPVSVTASDAGVDMKRISLFLSGDGQLESGEIDRLLSALKVPPPELTVR